MAPRSKAKPKSSLAALAASLDTRKREPPEDSRMPRREAAAEVLREKVSGARAGAAEARGNTPRPGDSRTASRPADVSRASARPTDAARADSRDASRAADSRTASRPADSRDASRASDNSRTASRPADSRDASRASDNSRTASRPADSRDASRAADNSRAASRPADSRDASRAADNSRTASRPSDSRDASRASDNSRTASRPADSRDASRASADSRTASRPSDSRDSSRASADSRTASRPADSRDASRASADSRTASRPADSRDASRASADSRTASRPSDSRDSSRASADSRTASRPSDSRDASRASADSRTASRPSDSRDASRASADSRTASRPADSRDASRADATQSRGSAFSTSRAPHATDARSPVRPTSGMPSPRPTPRAEVHASTRSWAPAESRSRDSALASLHHVPSPGPSRVPVVAPGVVTAKSILPVDSRRKYPRLGLGAKARLSMADSPNRFFEAALPTVNISVGGMFLRSSFFLKLGTKLLVELTLPPKGRLVRVKGEVVRVETSDEGHAGFALRFTEYLDGSEVILATHFLSPLLREFLAAYAIQHRFEASPEYIAHTADVLAAWELRKAELGGDVWNLVPQE